MVHCNELRIGNILLFDNEPSKITAIDLDTHGISKEKVADDKHQFIPISSGRVKGFKLTEEILTRSGFKKTGMISENMSKWTRDNSKFILHFNGKHAGLITSLPHAAPFEYLHQLQNLYFTVLAEELPVTLEELANVS